MEKKQPIRTCVVTREKYPKKELVRVVRTPEGRVEVDTTGRVNGKGAYLKLSKEVIEKAMKSKAIDRAIDVEVPSTIYEELMNLLK